MGDYIGGGRGVGSQMSWPGKGHFHSVFSGFFLDLWAIRGYDQPVTILAFARADGFIADQGNSPEFPQILTWNTLGISPCGDQEQNAHF
jgi:hypothetical protein